MVPHCTRLATESAGGARQVVNCPYGEEDFLGQFLPAWPRRRVVPSTLVGPYSHDTDRSFQLVGGISQRLVSVETPLKGL